MSSNIQIQRVCQHCGEEFTARTTVTRYCSHRCASAAHKARVRAGKVVVSNTETQHTISKPIQEIKAKEFLTVRDIATLLNCSLRTAYRIIAKGNIKAVNIAQRKTLVKRSEIDKLFEQPQPVKPQQEKQPAPVQLSESECYNLTEVQTKYGISEKALHEIIKRNNIPKFRKGWFALVPKKEIDKLLT